MSAIIGAVLVIGVWSVPTFRRVICCGRVAGLEQGVGDGYGLAALVDPVSALPRSLSPIFGKSLRVGVQYCKRWMGAMINRKGTAKVRNTKITATPSDETSISLLTTN